MSTSVEMVYVIDHVIGWVICRLGPIGDQDFENHFRLDAMIAVKIFEIVITVR